MLILAIETTGDVCSIAVEDPSGLLAERAFRHRMRLLQRLAPDTLAVLEDAGATLPAIDLFAVGLGPGSFTGVRVGVMTAKAWADALAKPLVGVGTLEAIAWEHGILPGAAIVAMVRARPGEVYVAAYEAEPEGLRAEQYAGLCREAREVAAYEAEPEGLRELSGAQVCAASEIAEFVDKLGRAQVLLCGDGLRQIGAEVFEGLRERGIEAGRGRCSSPRASTIASIARRRAADGRVSDPIDLTPKYVSPPQIREKAPKPSA